MLSKTPEVKMELRERPDTGVYVKDLTSFVTKSVEEIRHVMSVGRSNRSVGYVFFASLNKFKTGFLAKPLSLKFPHVCC